MPVPSRLMAFAAAFVFAPLTPLAAQNSPSDEGFEPIFDGILADELTIN